jgi:acyl-CoA synthetase (AMP-forming)/AMP-acid ligase II
MLSVSYATADKKPTGYANGGYGTEVDLTATYKITNNLTYTLGGGYLFTGDYFKGYDAGQPLGRINYVYHRGTLEDTRYSRGFSVLSNDIDNDFMIMNKLVLSF